MEKPRVLSLSIEDLNCVISAFFVVISFFFGLGPGVKGFCFEFNLDLILKMCLWVNWWDTIYCCPVFYPVNLHTALSRRIDSSYLFLQTDQNLCNSVLLVSNVQQMWCFHPQTVVSPRSNRCWCKIWDENSSTAVENSMLIIMLAYLFIFFFF